MGCGKIWYRSKPTNEDVLWELRMLRESLELDKNLAGVAKSSVLTQESQESLFLSAASCAHQSLKTMGSGLTSTREGFDVFCSHCKKLAASEDRAAWLADLCESIGLKPFYDRSDLKEITEAALKDAVTKCRVCVTVIDPFTFNSGWVVKENLWAANAGIPIVAIYDADRFRWTGQLDRWCQLYPFVFQSQCVAVTKHHRKNSLQLVLHAIQRALKAGITPPGKEIRLSVNLPEDHFRVGVGGSREIQTRSAVEAAYAGMMKRLGGSQPALIIVGFTATHEAKEAAGVLHELAPLIPMIGCTSCRGIILNDSWLTHQNEYACALWGVADDHGAYTTVHLAQKTSNLKEEVRTAVRRALRVRSDRPSFVILLGSPGDEELTVSGIVDAVGEDVPVIGGSSGDNNVEGKWCQISKVGTSNFHVSAPTVSSQGISIAIGWASCKCESTILTGFRQTDRKGKVTAVDEKDKGRTILEIDNRPASAVYDSWSRGELLRNAAGDNGDVATVLDLSALHPLGDISSADSIRVLHPAFIDKNSGAVTTFGNAYVGMDICLLHSSPSTLAKTITGAAKNVIAKVSSSEPHENNTHALPGENVVGMFMIFCGGLVMAIEDEMPTLVEHLARAVDFTTTMGICCFGEQGAGLQLRAMHANLSVGSLVFSKRQAPAAEINHHDTSSVELNPTSTCKTSQTAEIVPVSTCRTLQTHKSTWTNRAGSRSVMFSHPTTMTSSSSSLYSCENLGQQKKMSI